MEGTAGRLLQELESRRYQGRIVAVEHVRDLRQEIEGRHAQGLLDEEFYRECLATFTFDPAERLPGARSLIVVAVPQPAMQLGFTWRGDRVPVILPPTYVYAEAEGQVSDLLAAVLEPEGCRAVRAALPKKALAAHSGLARYGRNNISYVPGMGSFFGLSVFFSDLPCAADTWQEHEMLERCESCVACLRQCPVGAITLERFLLHAERCITFHNERAASFPFPSSIQRAWHNSILGCMRCQLACPENKPWLAWTQPGPQFSEEETALLLRGATKDSLPAETAARLRQAELIDALEVLPRNLGVLLDQA